MLVAVDDPKPRYYGGTVAAPIFKAVIEPSLIYLGYLPGSRIETISEIVVNAAASEPAVPKSPQQRIQGVTPQAR
jgi:hypothetical protein